MRTQGIKYRSYLLRKSVISRLCCEAVKLSQYSTYLQNFSLRKKDKKTIKIKELQIGWKIELNLRTETMMLFTK